MIWPGVVLESTSNAEGVSVRENLTQCGILKEVQQAWGQFYKVHF